MADFATGKREASEALGAFIPHPGCVPASRGDPPDAYLLLYCQHSVRLYFLVAHDHQETNRLLQSARESDFRRALLRRPGGDTCNGMVVRQNQGTPLAHGRVYDGSQCRTIDGGRAARASGINGGYVLRRGRGNLRLPSRLLGFAGQLSDWYRGGGLNRTNQFPRKPRRMGRALYCWFLEQSNRLIFRWCAVFVGLCLSGRGAGAFDSCH